MYVQDHDVVQPACVIVDLKQVSHDVKKMKECSLTTFVAGKTTETDCNFILPETI